MESHLVAKVSKSFHDVPMPSSITTPPIHEDFERGSIANSFRNKHWSELASQFVQSHPQAITFFSPEAFRFFLPGYLLLALQDLSRLDVSLVSLLSAFAGPCYEERFRLLNEDQLYIVLAVLDAITPDESDPYYWDFVHAKEGVLEYLTRPDDEGKGKAID